MTLVCRLLRRDILCGHTKHVSLRFASTRSTRSTSSCESDSEEWLRLTSEAESGFSSAFEDEEGNSLSPRGTLSHSRPLKAVKPVSTIIRDTSFVDWKRVRFRGGDGGDGCISFLHLINCHNAGPDGGDGGNGGHVVLKACHQVKSLANVPKQSAGDRGAHGQGQDMTGKSGEHKIIDVPIGTLIRRPTDYLILADLDRENSMFIAARGGAGGKGNHFFLSDKNRHPQVAEVGGKGQDNQYILEMKTVADVGLIGLPNVGKSTLLRAVSRARPRVASYPFTTLNPYVGVIEFEDYVQMSIADLPGLIEGAHQNRGLGIDFLKHVERCTCLIFVLDLSISEPWHQLLILKNELEKFKPGLSRRPHAIIGNKYDDSDAEYNLAKLKEFIEEATPENVLPLPVVPISAKYGVNVQDFLNHIRGLYDLYQVEQNPDDE